MFGGSQAKRRKARRTELTLQQQMELQLGGHGAFATEDEKLSAWEEHREELISSINLGHRPAAWWEFDAPEGVERPLHGHEDVVLFEAGLLDRPGELEQCTSWFSKKEEAVASGRTALTALTARAYHEGCRERGVPMSLRRSWPGETEADREGGSFLDRDPREVWRQ